MRFLSDFRRDAIVGVRLLGRYRGFSAIAIATLALAIGGNTAVFAFFNALLLTPPPVADPQRLVRVDTGQSLASWPNYLDIRDRTTVFTGVAASRLASLNLDTGNVAARLRGQITSPNFLSLLGVPAERGRTYAGDDMVFNRVVLARHIWRQHFGADPRVIGQTVMLGGRSVEVIGVMPANFRALAPPGVRLDFWLPLDPHAESASMRDRLQTQFELMARLKPDIEHGSATAALRSVAQRLRSEYPDLPESFLQIEARPVTGVYAFQGMSSFLLPLFAFLGLLTVVSGFVLVIGCSNIAGLLIGRGVMRQREIAVRLALGSSRGRLLRQLLTESLVLAVMGGLAGLALAAGFVAMIRIGVTRLPYPLALDLALDVRVLGYVLALSTATSLFFGLWPARSALRVELVSSLKTEASGSRERQRLRRLMVTIQVAACSALVVWSVLFLRSLGNIHSVDPGFDPTGVMLSALELDRGTINAERGDQILTEWTQRMAAAPGVQSVSIATVVPLALTGREEFDIALPTDAQGTKRRVVANRVTPGWFHTVRLPIVLGRDFTWSDRRGTTPVAIINESLARQFTNGTVLGQRLRYGTDTLVVVGIARDTKYWTLGEEPAPLVYLPLRQAYIFYVTLHARTSDPRGTAALMTSEMQRLLPGAQMDVVPMADAVGFAVMPARIGAAATGAFGVLAVGLAALGVYSLVSFSVLQRTREIGIRRATGATSADIVRLVVRDHATLIGLGLTVGVTTGALGGMVFRAFLTGVAPTDVLALTAAIVVVAGAALMASVLPVMRATRVDPMVALRDS